MQTVHDPAELARIAAALPSGDATTRVTEAAAILDAAHQFVERARMRDAVRTTAGVKSVLRSLVDRNGWGARRKDPSRHPVEDIEERDLERLAASARSALDRVERMHVATPAEPLGLLTIPAEIAAKVLGYRRMEGFISALARPTVVAALNRIGSERTAEQWRDWFKDSTGLTVRQLEAIGTQLQIDRAEIGRRNRSPRNAKRRRGKTAS